MSGVDATGGGGFTEEADDDPYNDFFQFSQQSFPSPSPGFYLPPLFSARRLLNIFSRLRPPPDEPVPQERSKRGFFNRRVRSNSSLELATTKPKPVPEGEVGECEGEQGQNIDDCGSTHNSLSARKDKGRQRDDPPAGVHSPLSYDRTRTTYFDSKDHRTLWERLLQSRGKNYTFGSLYPVI